jgi:hypothetical protein
LAKANPYGAIKLKKTYDPPSKRAQPIPTCDLYDKKPIPPSEIPSYHFLYKNATRLYNRGDLPLKLDYGKGTPGILWLIDVNKLDIKFYLPIFFNGLREKQDPYRFIALMGCCDMLNAGGAKIVPCIAQLINPIKINLATQDPEIIVMTLKMLQNLTSCHKLVGPCLVPYYKLF